MHHDVFRKIKVSFMCVGHTHEDIDAMFGVLSRLMSKKKYVTLEDMKPDISSVFVDGVQQVKFVHDFKAWLSPCLNNLAQHTEPRHVLPDSQKHDLNEPLINSHSSPLFDPLR